MWNTYSKFHLYIVFPFFEISHRRNITFINKFSIKIIHTWEEERNSLIFERCFHVVQTRWSTNGRGGGCTVPPRLFVNLVALREQTNVARHPLGDTRPAARAFYATIINRPGAAHSLSPRDGCISRRYHLDREEKFSGCRVSSDPCQADDRLPGVWSEFLRAKLSMLLAYGDGIFPSPCSLFSTVSSGGSRMFHYEFLKFSPNFGEDEIFYSSTFFWVVFRIFIFFERSNFMNVLWISEFLKFLEFW